MNRPSHRWPQFTLSGLFTLTFVCAAGMTSVSYMRRALNGEKQYAAVAILMGVAMPMLLAVVMSVVLLVSRRWKKRKKPPRIDDRRE